VGWSSGHKDRQPIQYLSTLRPSEDRTTETRTPPHLSITGRASECGEADRAAILHLNGAFHDIVPTISGTSCPRTPARVALPAGEWLPPPNCHRPALSGDARL